MSGLALAAVGGFAAGPAGAVNNNPAGNPTSPAVTYESDCTSSLQAGVAAPFVTATVINTTVDSAAPTGATFGIAGAVTQELPGAVIAGLQGALGPATLGLDVVQTFGSTDGHATGTYAYSHNFAPVTTAGGKITGVTAASGATTLSGNFTGVPAGAFLSSGLSAGIANGTVATTAGTATSITISIATTAALSAATVGWAPSSGMSYTDASFASPANAFTTAGVNGGTAGIGLVSSTSFTLVMTPNVEFGGTVGVGAANCLQTGWVNATTPGPAQLDETAPALPYGFITPLVSATPTFQSGAYVNLVDTPPTPNNQTVALGQGQNGSVTLTATPGSYPVGTFSLVGGSPQTIGTLTITQASAGSATINLSNTATAPETDTFQFNACDTLGSAQGGPVCSTAPGTITIKIGTPPVIQPFTEQVNGALLVLSCDSPSNYVTGNSNGSTQNGSGPTATPTALSANPLLQCPEFQFPSITLDGLEQTVTGTTGETSGNPSASNPGTIYISDNRGAPTDTWSLTGTFIPTAIGAGNGQNPNTSCLGIDAFCNSSVGAAALNSATNGAHDGQIAPNYLQVSAITCTADTVGGYGGAPPNLNPNATPTSGGNFGSPVSLCSAAAGQSGGTFLYNATYTLTIPESVYAGNYYGTVQYTIQ